MAAGLGLELAATHSHSSPLDQATLARQMHHLHTQRGIACRCSAQKFNHHGVKGSARGLGMRLASGVPGMNGAQVQACGAVTLAENLRYRSKTKHKGFHPSAHPKM